MKWNTFAAPKHPESSNVQGFINIDSGYNERYLRYSIGRLPGNAGFVQVPHSPRLDEASVRKEQCTGNLQPQNRLK